MGLGGSSPPKVLEESAILSIIIKIFMNTNLFYILEDG